MSRPWIYLGAAVLLLAILGGGGAVVTEAVVESERRRTMAQLLRDAAERYGLPPDWLEALGWQESDMNPQAHNGAGADGARGGAWGATQITLRTAQAYGFTGTGEELLASPELQADLTAKIVAAGPHTTPSDVAAWWNAGRRFDDLPTSPDGGPKFITRTKYVPSYLAKLADVRDAQVAEEATS